MFHSITEKMEIPPDIPEHLCGDVFILVIMDDHNHIIEPDEFNNVAAVSYRTQCSHGEM